MDKEQQPVETEQPLEVPATHSIQPKPNQKSKKRLILIISAVLLLLLAGSGAIYTILKKSPPEQSNESNQQVVSTSDNKTPEKKDTVQLVKVHYTPMVGQGARNDNDGRIPLLANGSYLSVNYDGELRYNGTIVKKDDRIRNPVLSKNGKHYAYQIELSPDEDQRAGKSELYIDNNKVSELDSSQLVAIADNGKDYLVINTTDKITATEYSTGIREQVIKLNNTKTIASSPYGFLVYPHKGLRYSADLQNILVESRTDGAGSYWYYNDQKLANCGDNTYEGVFNTDLSQDGMHTFCMRYTEEHSHQNIPIQNITKLQVFIDDNKTSDVTFPIDDGIGIAALGVSDKNNWMLFLDPNKVINSDDGTVKELSTVFPELAKGWNERNPICDSDRTTGYITASFGQIIELVNTSKFAVLTPCAVSKKLFVKGFDFDNLPDLSAVQEFFGIEYSATDKKLYIYTN